MIGIIVLIIGCALTLYYRPIADTMGSGIASYDRYRLVGLIACGVGFLVMLNLHSLLLGWFFGMLFNRG